MDSLTLNKQRLVHLDLKGAPPKLSFFEKFFPFVKDIGATGLLVEWEDTFPYTRELIQIGGLSSSAQNAGAPYNIEEAKQLIRMAEDSGLIVIPLVQTFGHMEFILKHDQWRGLREIENYPSSMCPSNSLTMPLVRALITQIAGFHSNSQFIHIGADEVWHMGHCPSCVRRSQNSKYGKASLYLDHVSEVAHFIKDHFPQFKVIIWDDMLRGLDINILQEYYLGNLVEPMVWHYNNSETFSLGGTLWDKYSSVFKNVWAATAFKGSTSSCQILPVNRYHVSNHESWLTELNSHSGKLINFRGVALTGWSRYDHYATLCELLPCALPTLSLCLKTWLSGGFNSDVYSFVSKSLGYTDSEATLHLDHPVRPTVLAPQLTFPGWQVLLAFEWFTNIRSKYKTVVDSDQIQTWLNQWQISNNYTNPMQIESILPVLTSLHLELLSMETYCKSNLEQYFYPHTINELIGTLIHPMKQHIRQLKDECETQIDNGCRVLGHKLI